jgi:hypothetical protein
MLWCAASRRLTQPRPQPLRVIADRRPMAGGVPPQHKCRVPRDTTSPGTSRASQPAVGGSADEVIYASAALAARAPSRQPALVATVAATYWSTPTRRASGPATVTTDRRQCRTRSPHFPRLPRQTGRPGGSTPQAEDFIEVVQPGASDVEHHASLVLSEVGDRRFDRPELCRWGRPSATGRDPWPQCWLKRVVVFAQRAQLLVSGSVSPWPRALPGKRAGIPPGTRRVVDRAPRPAARRGPVNRLEERMTTAAKPSFERGRAAEVPVCDGQTLPDTALVLLQAVCGGG